MPRLTPLLLAVCAVALGGCNPPITPGSFAKVGDPGRGHDLIGRYGCGACHKIPGIEGASGLAGPPLDEMADRTVIAGLLPNTPPNMIRWLEAPQSVVPGNAMPNMELNDHDAADIAAYLYSLR